MKIFKHIIWSMVLVSLLSACDEDFDKATFDPLKSKAAELSAIDSEIVLEAVNKENIAAVFSWLQTHISYSAAVNYELQVDVKGQNFTNYVVIASMAINNELDEMEYKPKTSYLNSKLLELLKKYEELDGTEPVDFSFRVVAVIAPNHKLSSNVIDSKITVYLVNPDGTTDDGTRIYMVGAAVPAGWNPGDAVEMVNIGPGTYRATTTFTNDRFRFLGQKDWGPVSYNYPFFTSVPADYFENARQPDREDGDENLWFKGEPGDYVITVKIDTKTITIIPAPTDGTVDDGTRIYMVGAAVPAGWSPGDAVEMVNIAPNVYRATTTFSVERFRFLGQKDWGPVSYNFPYFTGYVSNMLENARQPDREDGDENLWFKGPAGTYVITVDLEKKSIVIDLPYSDDGTRVYIVGAAVPAGWNPGDAIEMVNIAPNRYRATTTFANDRFRFLGQKDWGPDSWNFPFFTTVPAAYLENARQPDREDGDENIWFKGTPGEYTMTIDLAEKWIIIF